MKFDFFDALTTVAARKFLQEYLATERRAVEVLCRELHAPTLSWGIGRQKTALKNMPVVDGFQHQLQLPPILVAENLFIDIMSGAAGVDAVGQTVETWQNKMAGDH